MKDKCTVLVSSCDSYSETWEPFFKLLKKYWPTRKYPIVLNTETKDFSYEDMDIKVINLPDRLKNKKYVTWGKRMQEVMKQIDTEYVIFLLDDFFLTDYVDENRLDEVFSWLEDDKEKNIAVFSFYSVSKSKYPDEVSTKYKGYALRNKKGPYRYNCQAAIWRTEVLKNCFRKHENPWEWELYGNKRSWRSSKEFYTLISKDDLIFKYYFCDIGIVKGRWKLPETKDFMEKENIEIDYAIRNNLKETQIKEQEEKIKNAKERGKVYYFMFRFMRRLRMIKDKIMTLFV